VSDGYYASARKLRFQNRHGQEVFASYYPPTNPDITTGADDSRPPLIVICHGGPTGQSSTALDPRKLFWTSRGYALLDVDYSGSTGYGRAYRERLNGQWGKLDVEDCCDAALFAVSAGLADADRLIIRGSSAGGLTVLAALTFHDVFAAGACYYGISDLAGLADATHKFESRYNDIIIGPYPETKALYRERSPIHHSDQLNKPVIFFQGVDDCVVPMAQTQMMVSALRDRGIRVAAQYFAGEQHGFRQSSTIENCLENELTFYRLVMDIDGEDDAVTMQFRGDIELSNM
jgi:dipeptidyl aminopeptidase/acylaminoacyl peptidase